MCGFYSYWRFGKIRRVRPMKNDIVQSVFDSGFLPAGLHGLSLGSWVHQHIGRDVQGWRRVIPRDRYLGYSKEIPRVSFFCFSGPRKLYSSMDKPRGQGRRDVPVIPTRRKGGKPWVCGDSVKGTGGERRHERRALAGRSLRNPLATGSGSPTFPSRYACDLSPHAHGEGAGFMASAPSPFWGLVHPPEKASGG